MKFTTKQNVKNNISSLGLAGVGLTALSSFASASPSSIQFYSYDRSDVYMIKVTQVSEHQLKFERCKSSDRSQCDRVLHSAPISIQLLQNHVKDIDKVKSRTRGQNAARWGITAVSGVLGALTGTFVGSALVKDLAGRMAYGGVGAGIGGVAGGTGGWFFSDALISFDDRHQLVSLVHQNRGKNLSFSLDVDMREFSRDHN